MSAKSVKEDIELVKGGGAPKITQSPSIIVCEAVVLHQSEEQNLLRHLRKILEPGESESHISQKKKALTKHMFFTAGMTSIIVFIVAVSYLVSVNRPLTLSDSLLGGFVAAAAAFIVEAIIIGREYNL